MHENIRLLMEETDCERGEAELALELAGNDLEQAIKTIGSLLRHIVALKGKFSFPQKNLYGLLLVVVNTKSREILRLRTVVSYNPALYETAPELDWYAFEKLLFSYRLDQGSLPDFTRELEERFHAHLADNRDALGRFDMAEVSALIDRFLAPEQGAAQLSAEELNLTQFRKLPSEGPLPDDRPVAPATDTGLVTLAVSLQDDPSGIPVERLAEGDIVLTHITDDRDIAHYLAHLVGAKRGEEMIPLPAAVKRLAVSGNEAEVQVSFAPNIVGIARIAPASTVKIVAPRAQSWWQKIVPWS